MPATSATLRSSLACSVLSLIKLVDVEFGQNFEGTIRLEDLSRAFTRDPLLRGISRSQCCQDWNSQDQDLKGNASLSSEES